MSQGIIVERPLTNNQDLLQSTENLNLDTQGREVRNLKKTLRFAHRHIVSEQGQIYLIGALVDQRETEEDRKRKKAKKRWWKQKRSNIFPADRDVHVGIYGFGAESAEGSVQPGIKAIVFRCASDAQLKALLDESHYEVVGPWLVQRHRDELGVWVTRISTNEGTVTERNLFGEKLKSNSFSLQTMMHDITDINHVIFYKVPASSHLTIKSRPKKYEFKYY